MHDTLDVIEKDMLVILSQAKLRLESKELKKRFKDIHQKCMDDKNPEYCTKGVPLPMPGVSRVATAVEVTLNKDTEQALAEKQLHVDLYTPNSKREIMKSLSYNEWENLERV